MRMQPSNVLVLLSALAMGPAIAAQVQTIVPPVIPGAKPVTVEHIKIHGQALESNLEGDAVDRDVIVFLPPSYAKEKSRRYPVVYALHGYSIGAEQWSHEIHVPQTIEGAFAQGAKEVIVVLPDSKTIYNGSMYSSSPTTGDTEQYISHDVVSYIGQRTIAPFRNAPAAAWLGHSMGGYGASRIGIEAPRCLRRALHHEPLLHVPNGRVAALGTADRAKEMAIASEKESCRCEIAAGSGFAVARLWLGSIRDGRWHGRRTRQSAAVFRSAHWARSRLPEILAKYAANAPLAFVDQYIGNLRQYRAIALDVGDQDGLRIDAGKLHEIFDKYRLREQL